MRSSINTVYREIGNDEVLIRYHRHTSRTGIVDSLWPINEPWVKNPSYLILKKIKRTIKQNKNNMDSTLIMLMAICLYKTRQRNKDLDTLGRGN